MRNATGRRTFLATAGLAAAAAARPLSAYGQAVDNAKQASSVSDKPGIGVEINEEGMRRYATQGVPFFA